MFNDIFRKSCNIRRNNKNWKATPLFLFWNTCNKIQIIFQTFSEILHSGQHASCSQKLNGFLSGSTKATTQMHSVKENVWFCYEIFHYLFAKLGEENWFEYKLDLKWIMWFVLLIFWSWGNFIWQWSLPRHGSFFIKNSSRAHQPPPTRTMTVLLRILTKRSFCSAPNYIRKLRIKINIEHEKSTRILLCICPRQLGRRGTFVGKCTA